MAAIDFPANPANGATHTHDGRTWTFSTGHGWIPRPSALAAGAVDGAAVKGLSNTSSGFVQIQSGAFSTGTISVADNSIGADQLDVSGDGTAGQALLSDGDGTMSWGAAGSSEQVVQAKLQNAGSINIVSNATTRFSDSQSGTKRLWAVPASGAGSFDQLLNGSDVTGAQQYCCMRTESGGLYDVHIDGIGVLFCGLVSSTNQGSRIAAQQRLMGLEIGLQFAWKLPTSSTWSSWLDCRRGADQSASIGGSTRTLYDHEKVYGGSGNPGGIEADNLSTDNNRFVSLFKTKFIANNADSENYWADIAPPFWANFAIGTNQMLPYTGVDYRFRFIFAAMAGSIDNNAATIELIYNYSEKLVAKRLS